MAENLKALMKEAFQNCMVINGKINFFKTFSKEDLFAIYTQFSSDLLDYNIPHYRVVGIKWHVDLGEGSVFRINRDYGQSIIDLAQKAQAIIPMEIGGNNPAEGCFWTSGEHVEVANGMSNNTFGPVLKVPTSEVGQLIHYTLNKDMDAQREITTDTIGYCKFNIGEGLDKPMYLIPHVNLGVADYHAIKDYMTTFFFMKGKGKKSYSQNARLFTYDSGVFPCNTIFDLSRFVVCKYVDASVTDGLNLIYRSQVDENVLTHILQEYGKGFGEE